MNEWSELNLIKKDEVLWLVECGLICCNFLLLEWIEIQSLVRKSYVELLRFFKQIGNFRSFSFYDFARNFFPKKHEIGPSTVAHGKQAT